jgi:hypothetical protein
MPDATDERAGLPGPADGDPAAVERRSVITCPTCGFAQAETMPTDACWFFYDCAGCGAVLRPKPGDCCVFCSYGSLPCPPIQADRQSRGDCCRG